MKTHTVKTHESLESIARGYGIANWRAIYDHPSNAVFRKLRPNPSRILAGDIFFIPDHLLPQRAQAKNAPAPSTSVFEQYIQHLTVLEQAAITAGHTSVQRRITDFRLLYYPNGASTKDYAGVTFGGGAWNILIPGAALDRTPQNWSDAKLRASRDFLIQHKVIGIRGSQVDMGHLFAGLDAGNHPTSISLAGLFNLKSNMAASTYAGDLGSIVGEYANQNSVSVHALASKVDSARLNKVYDEFMSDADCAGNADAYALTVNTTRTVAQNLSDYYLATTGGVTQRYPLFMQRASLNNRARVIDLVFNSAMAYEASQNRKAQALAVIANPGPQLFGYNLWDVYFNATQWTVDLFMSRLQRASARR